MQNSLTIRLFVASLLTSLLSGCAVLAVGGVAAGVSVMADRRSSAVQAIDKGISLEVENALGKKFGDNAHINVTSFNQKVLLTGEVKDAGIKEQAGAYVKANKNVRSVFNELIISPNSAFSARANDSYLASKIKTQMIFTNKLPSNSMAIVAEGSSIYLLGMLTQSEAEAAKAIASNTNGVKDVYAYFDIISDAEKSRLEKQGMADEPQPNSTSQ
jgi:osmotically-inducible protein OsmY